VFGGFVFRLISSDDAAGCGAGRRGRGVGGGPSLSSPAASPFAALSARNAQHRWPQRGGSGAAGEWGQNRVLKGPVQARGLREDARYPPLGTIEEALAAHAQAIQKREVPGKLSVEESGALSAVLACYHEAIGRWGFRARGAAGPPCCKRCVGSTPRRAGGPREGQHAGVSNERVFRKCGMPFQISGGS
jgi:hypothetical protein